MTAFVLTMVTLHNGLCVILLYYETLEIKISVKKNFISMQGLHFESIC